MPRFYYDQELSPPAKSADWEMAMPAASKVSEGLGFRV